MALDEEVRRLADAFKRGDRLVGTVEPAAWQGAGALALKELREERDRYREALEAIADDLGHPSYTDMSWVCAMEALGKDVDGAIEGWNS